MMSRTASCCALAYAGLLLVTQGCSHLVETKTIERFTVSLKEQDVDRLKRQTSERFGERALRHAEAMNDLKILNLPSGEVSIAKIEDISETEKHVAVEVGESKRKLLYKLVMQQETGDWVVDDIYMKQKHKGLTVAKSVTEQMDLLLSVREFLEAWERGERNDVLSVTTPEFAELIGKLPPAYLARLTQQVVDGRAKKSQRPQAQLDGDMAVVRLTRKSGELVLTYVLQEGTWKVSDLAIESRIEKEHIASLRKLATAVHTAFEFLRAYGSADEDRLQQVCTLEFWQGSLSVADLAQVPLPSAESLGQNYEIRMQGNHADFMIQSPEELVKVSMLRRDTTGADETARYAVADVTIYEVDGTQEKRLAALFTAHAMLHVFSEGLIHRDLAVLRHSSSRDLNERIWERLTDSTLHTLPLLEIEPVHPVITETRFQGSVTEVAVRQGSQQLVYMLRERSGRFFVDDVLLPAENRPASLKHTLELLLPVQEFAAGIRLSQVDLLQRVSSRDFIRLAWLHVDSVPDIGLPVSEHLAAPLGSIQAGERPIVILGDDRFGARVQLLLENDRYVVDDVMLVAGPEPERQKLLKHTVRTWMATRNPEFRESLGSAAAEALPESLPSPAPNDPFASNPLTIAE